MEYIRYNTFMSTALTHDLPHPLGPSTSREFPSPWTMVLSSKSWIVLLNEKIVCACDINLVEKFKKHNMKSLYQCV